MIITCPNCQKKNKVHTYKLKQSQCRECKFTFNKIPTEEGFCSFCFEKGEHLLIEQNYIRRNTYQCTKCKKRTHMCRFCTNFSKGGDHWDDELCAEHSGEIGSFQMLNYKLQDIEDFKILFKRDSVNISKVSKVALATVGTAAVITPLALIAAPAIGGAIATTEIGIGAFSVLASESIIGASLVAGTGTFGGVIANNYFGDIKDFDIILIKEGIGDPVIFIDGFLTENELTTDSWEKELKEIYPNNPWYYLTWESKKLQDIGKTLALGLGKQAVKSGVVKLAKQAATKVNPLTAGFHALGIINNPWSIACTKAGQTGIVLADILSRTDKRYILCGHSLGARVIFYTLEALEKQKNIFVSTVHLLGGAVGSKKEDWETASKAVSNNIINYRSDKDMVLKTMYTVGTFFTSDPIGRNDIEVDSIINIDVSNIVDGHTKYKENFSKFLKQRTNLL